jgi:hypothetical protein
MEASESQEMIYGGPLTGVYGLRVPNWRAFGRRIRSRKKGLLGNLDRYDNAILVGGCQRSGTTAIARLIGSGPGINEGNVALDELKSAKVLAGLEHLSPHERYCFQTTYLNERYVEYFEHTDYRLVWVIRNPHSVVYSLVHNWRRFALDELFKGCGAQLLQGKEQRRLETFGAWSFTALKKACLSYNAKGDQFLELRRRLPKGRMLAVSYDRLVADKEGAIALLGDFLGVPRLLERAHQIHDQSLSKANQLSIKESKFIDAACSDAYRRLLDAVAR